MKKCRYCQSEIDSKASVCPYCKRKQSHDGLIIVLVLIGTLLLLAIGVPIIKGFTKAANTPNTSVSVGTSTTQEKTEAAEPVVIYDKDGIKISYINVVMDKYEAKINLLLENNSDIAKMIQTRDTSINGYMVDDIFSADIPAGKKSYDDVDILSQELEKNKITDIKDIEFHFIIVNSDDWNVKTESEAIKITVTKGE